MAEEEIKKWKEELEQLKCPISLQIMRDPVILETGQAYERKFIETWLIKNSVCPTTGQKLNDKKIIPAFQLKAFINNSINRFVKNVVKNVPFWYLNDHLIDDCKDLVTEAIGLITKESDKQSFLELNKLHFEITTFKLNNGLDIVEEDYLDSILKNLETVEDLEIKLYQLQKVESKIKENNNLKIFYENLLKIFILMEDDEKYNEMKKIFNKYIKNGMFDDKTICEVLNIIKEDELLEYFDQLMKNGCKKSLILQNMADLNFKIPDKNIYINIIKECCKEVVDFSSIDINNLQVDMKNFDELIEEKKKLYIYLYENEGSWDYLEYALDLDEKDEMIINKLSKIYLENGMYNDYTDLYLKNNDNIDPKTLTVIKEQSKAITKLTDFVGDVKLDLHHISQVQFYKNSWGKHLINLKIATPIEQPKEMQYRSDKFEMFGFKWFLVFVPKSDKNSTDNEECFFYIYISGFKNNSSREVESIKINYFISNTNFDYESIVTGSPEYKDESHGWGKSSQLQYYIPTLKKGKKIYKFIFGMKDAEIKYK